MKTLLMLKRTMKNIIKNTMHIVQELRLQELIFLHNHLKLNYKSFYLSATTFDVILSH